MREDFFKETKLVETETVRIDLKLSQEKIKIKIQ